MKLVYHRGALDDLAAIREYISQDDPVVARKVIDRIQRSAAYLVRSPNIGRPGPDGTRLLSVAGLPYVIVHRMRGDAISIVAIFHTSRNRTF